MFTMKDNFSGHDENRQPYSFEVEQHTYVENLHAGVCDGRFHLKSVGNRHVLNTPPFKTGCFSMEFCITVLKQFDPVFTILFQYDKKIRSGMGLRFHYELAGILHVELIQCREHRILVLDEKFIQNFKLEDSKVCSMDFIISKKGVFCKIGEAELSFECECQKGQLAIERDNFIGELILQNISFESEDDFEICTVLEPVTAEIPLVNGGDIPYRITWQIDKTEGEYFLKYILDGGTGTRKYNKSDRPGQFSVETDYMTTPYVGVSNGSKEELFNIAVGEMCFVDPNIYWECQKDIFGNVPLPVTGCFRINSDLILNDKLSDGAELIFGYENLACNGYPNQRGGNEFRYDASGKPTYSGAAQNGKDVFEIFSPFDKYAMSLIPDDCCNREEVEEHIRYNHYFECSEDIHFSLNMKTMLKSSYIDVAAEIINVYETETLAQTDTHVITESKDNGYSIIKADAHFCSLDTGVYKVVFKIFYGGRQYKEVKNVFEVFNKDTDDIPALKSGLPFIFSMANEIKWLKRNAFDLWNPMHSCDGVHYISCVTDTPIEAENRRTWELTKPFKRKWFAWIAPRTCTDYSDAENHIDTIKNADYLFWAQAQRGWSINSQFTQYPLRSDHWSFITTKSPFHQEVLKEFLKENPHAAKVVAMDFENEDFTNDHYERLMSEFRVEWITYMNDHVLKILEKQNAQLEELNPGIRRSMYGPVNIYITPTISYRSLPDYGLPNDNRLAEKVFNGFAVFEDYPHACSYPTYRGPFALASILLHCPKLRVYPEQYSGGRGGSIDGAVKFANAPRGAYKVEPYMNSTHSFEYVFNTPYRLEDGYHYWDTYGFHRRSHGTPMLDELARDWKYVIENKPQKPLRSMAFIAEYDESDTVFDISVNNEGNKIYAFCNQSEIASGFIHECSREAGIPNGFSMKFDTLSTLSADECDLLVVPTLKNAEPCVKDEIRRLYNEGVNLIALSDITGLEDIFGVLPHRQSRRINTLTYCAETENIYSTDAVFNYKSCGAEAIMLADEALPAIFATERTVLINTHILSLGCENKEQRESRPNAYCVVGRLIRKALTDTVRRLSKPFAVGDNVGVTLFESQSGHTELMAINYVPYNNRQHDVKEAVIHFDMDNLIDVKSDRELYVCKENGIVKEIRFNTKPFETVFAELILG